MNDANLTTEDVSVPNGNDLVAPALTPLVSADSVVEATRGRQAFNDSDKDNYFEA
ncbi:hypothetical protein [Streptomyces sp. CFMR 7]|uniref:hypothetical protein n=1 Tax=Streptomyces sp. CFMR 7 TaxID=1649184 RepID=UPI001642464F|nr:hypothetical protein [Streptomyces sp. CFMR 7]